MEISSNVIRFPASPTLSTSRVAAARQAEEKPADVVNFPAGSEESSVDSGAQSHGQFYAAARIVGRVADQLDALPNL